jgi:hypothetical protein
MATSLCDAGYQAIIVALNDKHLQVDEIKEYQYDEEKKIAVLRYSQFLQWKKKIKKLQNIVNDSDPDWISFQYVSYGFDKKGLPFYLPKMLQQLSGHFKWHFMFHETWAGISDSVALRHRIYGYFQKRIAVSLIRSLKPEKITTTNILYQLVLREKNINASCIPLFSNISVHQRDEAFLASIEMEYDVSLKNEAYYKLGIFGTSYPEANLYSVIPGFIESKKTNQKVVLLIFGKNGRPEEIFKLKKHLPPTIIVAELGELNEASVSSVMSILDEAVLCTPVEYMGKSGAYAALKLHDVKVAILSSAPIAKYEKQILEYNNYLSERSAGKWDVQHVRDRFISLLNSE